MQEICRYTVRQQLDISLCFYSFDETIDNIIKMSSSTNEKHKTSFESGKLRYVQINMYTLLKRRKKMMVLFEEEQEMAGVKRERIVLFEEEQVIAEVKKERTVL